MKRFGGHKQAAGLQIESVAHQGIPRRPSTTHADAMLGPDDLRPPLWLDGPLAFSDINERVMSEFAALAPFGPGNPRPVFHTSGGRDRRRPARAEGAAPEDDA